MLPGLLFMKFTRCDGGGSHGSEYFNAASVSATGLLVLSSCTSAPVSRTIWKSSISSVSMSAGGAKQHIQVLNGSDVADDAQMAMPEISSAVKSSLSSNVVATSLLRARSSS